MEDDKDNFIDLLNLAKDKCYITDTSDLIISRFRATVKDSIKKVSDYIGVEKYDFSKPSSERDLLLNYCFYAWNDRPIKEFEDNYISDILKLRHKHLVEDGEDNDKL